MPANDACRAGLDRAAQLGQRFRMLARHSLDAVRRLASKLVGDAGGQLAAQRLAQRRRREQRDVDDVEIDRIHMIARIGQQIERAAELFARPVRRSPATARWAAATTRIRELLRVEHGRVAHRAREQLDLQMCIAERKKIGGDVRSNSTRVEVPPQPSTAAIVCSRDEHGLDRRRILGSGRAQPVAPVARQPLAADRRHHDQLAFERRRVGRLVGRVPAGQPARGVNQRRVPEGGPGGEQLGRRLAAEMRREVVQPVGRAESAKHGGCVIVVTSYLTAC